MVSAQRGADFSANQTLRAIGPESTEIDDALREDWTAVWPKGKPLLIGYHFAWPKKEVRLEDSILSEKLFEAHKALNALIRDYQSAARPNLVTHCNASSRPFMWTATADSILNKLYRSTKVI
jgi:hypothetical protein